MKILTNLDLAKNELQNPRIQNLATDPANPVQGQIYFNTTNKTFYGYSGTAWIDLGQVLTGDSIVALVNACTSKIDDDNLSANVNDAISKRHSHANKATLDAIEAAYTTAEKNKLAGISTGANKVEQSTINGNIKIDGVEKTVYIHPGSGTNPHGTTKADIGLGNVENKSSADIRSEITSANVTSALGYTPVKNGGNSPEIKSGNEVDRPTATGSGLIYFATDTKKIWKDTAVNTWTQMGGQDLPIASTTVLGGIKVGANLTILADGTLNANDNPASFIIKQEQFTVAQGQTTFTLTKGTYKPGTNSLFWYMYGQKQPNDALIETSPTTFQIAGNLEPGTDILVEYIEVINADSYPEHASEHLSGGVDPIPTATTAADGLMSAADKAKLDGVAPNANNYVHPTGDGNLHVPATGTTNNGKVLKAGATAGSISWGTLSAADVGAVPTSDVVTTATANKLLKLDSSGNLPTSITGNAATATKLQTARSIGLAGDLSGSANFDGTANISINAILANSGVTAGTYTKVTVDAKGRVTSATQLTAADIPALTLSKITDAGTAASKNVGTAVGNVPVIGVDGKLDSGIMPAITITDTFVVNSETAMLALAAQTGDVCVRTDLSKSFILKGADPTVLANWQELLTPTDVVQSVNGKTGVVILTKADVGLGNVDNIQQATKTEFNTHKGDIVRHITSTERTAWNAKTAKYSALIGDGSTTQFTVTHNLGTMDVVATLRENASPYNVVYADIQIVDANNIKLLFSSAPTSNQYRLTVVG